ncbi:N-acetylglucosaminyl deacetylase, LmbE family [Poseidonocella pacifica]|uniref:N-acetylglucosaminyl deacetylase, LmbE family n=1 Tax=Poseidonocella pacifica TaxID=871651 RepID=A0A1I0YS55_9RHOB|nr:PIG-L family deacetylase [Poseidonocella pacifica]SFB16209.1 N-acetylglucosaminyl deacetylase, LmbE family [Poseidonocella pacifica]
MPQVMTFEELSQGAPICVLSPHPDDESLGCGALLAAAFSGPGADVICMTDGSASHPGSTDWPPDRLAQLRATELQRAIEILGGRSENITHFVLPDGRLPALSDRFDEIAARISQRLRTNGARSLFAPARTDPHCDHEATAEIAARAARDAGVPLFSYPIWSAWYDQQYREKLQYKREIHFNTGFAREAKDRAIAAHRSQHGTIVRDSPDGFVLPEDFLAGFRAGPEIFFEVEN